MRKKVNPTRMELMRTRKRLDLAVRGHKLLKDKLEGLIKELTERLPEYKELRLKVDEMWPKVFQRFALADADASASATETAIMQARPRVEITSEIERIMGVVVTKADATVLPGTSTYSLVQTSPHLDGAINELKDFLPALIKLAGLEQAVRALSEEIQKTRRRANALEHVLIPDLQATKKIISSSIEEMARSDVSRLMKVKQMLLDREMAEAS
jgi:V/A-type H+/Na+-transporting ATPase subunit D